jgi:hypothetical protein
MKRISVRLAMNDPGFSESGGREDQPRSGEDQCARRSLRSVLVRFGELSNEN